MIRAYAIDNAHTMHGVLPLSSSLSNDRFSLLLLSATPRSGAGLSGAPARPWPPAPRYSNRPPRRGIILHGTEAIDSSSCKGRAASLGRCSMEPRDRYMAGTCAASVSTGSSRGKVGGGAVSPRTWRPELQFPNFAVKS